MPFIRDMAEAFAQADLVVGRAGAGAVNEIAAAGMPSVLVPLPFAADDHQRRNAEALVEPGAARMILDADLNGERLFREVETLRESPARIGADAQPRSPICPPGRGRAGSGSDGRSGGKQVKNEQPNARSAESEENYRSEARNSAIAH